ncbi:MAG: O-methyltransferase, partial [candidate division Zixibacteria bacterium]|nr:O-methyltransferase [candidate division Zixibacteria bacterium]
MRKDVKELLEKLNQKNEKEKKAGLPIQRRMRSIPPETGLFLYLLVKISKAQKILEIGTSQGYSTIWLAQAAEEIGGKVTTLEINPTSAAKAEKNLKQVKLDRFVEIKIGDAERILPNMREKFDFVFIDAEKKGYLTYFDLVRPILKENGLIVADNVISHAESLANYTDSVQKHPDFQSLIVPIGSGEMLSL